MPRKKKYPKKKYPEINTARLVQEAMAKDGLSQEETRVLCGLAKGELPRWFNGRRKAPSPAFCNGFKDLFSALPSLDQKEFLSKWLTEMHMDVPNPYKGEPKKGKDEENDDR